MLSEELQSKIDKNVAIRFGVTEFDIKALREYEKTHGKFHEQADLHTCHRIAREWYKKQSEVNNES